MAEAWDAYREGTVPIGAVVVDSDGAIVATGRNRQSTNDGVATEAHGNPLAHAELNALLAASAERSDLRGCSLYTTMEPCPLCTGALAMAHVGLVAFAARDLWAGSLDLLEASAFLRSRQIRVAGPHDSRLEEVMLAMNVVFWLRQTTPAARQLVELWRVAFPGAVELGERLHASGALEVAAREAWPAQEMLPLFDGNGAARRFVA